MRAVLPLLLVSTLVACEPETNSALVQLGDLQGAVAAAAGMAADRVLVSEQVDAGGVELEVVVQGAGLEAEDLCDRVGRAVAAVYPGTVGVDRVVVVEASAGAATRRPLCTLEWAPSGANG